MQVRGSTLRFNPVAESFDDGMVAGFMADRDVLSIRDHFFLKDDLPYLTPVGRFRSAALSGVANTGRSEQNATTPGAIC